MPDSVVGRIVGVLDIDDGKFKAKMAGASDAWEQGGLKSAAFGLAAGGVLLGVGIAAGKFAEQSYHAFAKVQVSLVGLATAIKNTGASWADFKAPTQEAINQGEKFGFTADDTASALSTMTTMTGNASKAYKDLGLVMNLAHTQVRGSEIGLAAASMYVSKAEMGKVSALQRVLPFLNKNMSAQQALAAMEKASADQAANYAKTDQGRIDALAASWQGFKEQVGAGISPTVSDSLTKTTSDLDILTKGTNDQRLEWLRLVTLWQSDTPESAELVESKLAQLRDAVEKNGGVVDAATSGISDLNTASNVLAGTQQVLSDGTVLTATQMDAEAAAIDKLDSSTVSWVRDMNGAIVGSTTLAAALRDESDKHAALTAAQLADHVATDAVAAAKKKYGVHSIEYRAAVDAEKQAHLKAKDAAKDYAAAVQLVKDRQAGSAGQMQDYIDSLNAMKASAKSVADNFRTLYGAGWAKVVMDSANYGGSAKHASGTVTSGPEHALIGEDGTEVVIPVGNPRYRSQAKGLLAYAQAALGVGNAKGDVGGEGAGLMGQLPPFLSQLSSVDYGAAKDMKGLVSALGPIGAMKTYANSKVGDPYVWGASGPNAFDCSGLASAILSAGGFHYGRFTTATEPSLFSPGRGRNVTLGLVPGHHTGIEIAGGWYEAPHTGANVRGPGAAKSSWPEYLHIPGYRNGTSYVPNDGPAYLHKGETVVPAGNNSVTVPVYLDGALIASYVADLNSGELSDITRRASAMALGGYRG